MPTKKELENKKELARLYYMQGETQESIAAKIGCSKNTVGRWVEANGWAEKRAGMNITRPEIVTKTLRVINNLVDKLYAEDTDLTDVGKIVDQLCKLAAIIERIDKKATVVDAIEVFTSLNKWLEARMQWDKNITPELISTLAHYQDLYVSEMVANKK